MNVGDLKKMLEQYPDDMPVIHDMYSDYTGISEEDWSVVEAVFKRGDFYYMRSHPTMSSDNKEAAIKCLHLVGN